MPVFASWILSGPVMLSPFSPPPSLPPFLGGAVECDAPYFTQEELLRVVQRAYPVDYVLAMQSKPDGGYEIFQAAAKVLERVSIAMARLMCCAFIIHAGEGTKAAGVVEFYREDDAAGELTYKAGSVVRTSNGKEFVTLEDAVFGPTDLGPVVVSIESVDYGYVYNVAGAVTTAGGELLEGDINDIKFGIVEDAGGNPTIDLNMRVRNVQATTGGADKCLEALGQDVGIFRNLGESIEAYRLRIQTTPDTVSPDAIRRGVNDLLAPYDSAVCLREVGTDLFPGFFYDAGSSADSPQDAMTNFAYDMDFEQRPEDRFKLYLNTLEFRGFFLVGLPKFEFPSFAGLVYDTSSADTFPIRNAFDTTAMDAENAAWDGSGAAQLQTGIYKSIYDVVDAKRAGGVGFELYIEEIGCF